MFTNVKMPELEPRAKLRATLEVKRIARSGLNNCYDQLDDWKELHKRLRKERKDLTNLEFKIDLLEEEIDKIEENSANMNFGGVIEGGNGFGSSGCGNNGCE